MAPTTEGEDSEGSGDYDSEELEEIFSIGTHHHRSSFRPCSSGRWASMSSWASPWPGVPSDVCWAPLLWPALTHAHACIRRRVAQGPGPQRDQAHGQDRAQEARTTRPIPQAPYPLKAPRVRWSSLIFILPLCQPPHRPRQAVGEADAGPEGEPKPGAQLAQVRLCSVRPPRRISPPLRYWSTRAAHLDG